MSVFSACSFGAGSAAAGDLIHAIFVSVPTCACIRDLFISVLHAVNIFDSLFALVVNLGRLRVSRYPSDLFTLKA